MTYTPKCAAMQDQGRAQMLEHTSVSDIQDRRKTT